MDLSQFQRAALETDHTTANYEHAVQRDVVVALLGIAGELGTLATTYKKYIRDGAAYELHKDHVAEELGDLLWYAAILANKFGLDLEEIAERNLAKVKDRWSENEEASLFEARYDAQFPADQQLPRQFRIAFSEHLIDGRKKAVMEWDGRTLGDPLTDNADNPDGYRYHDAFHLAFAAILGWSPVLRKLMGRKRRDDQTIDENEDGGRAIVIEEGIAALVFDYGSDNGDLVDAKTVDYDLLKTLKSTTRRLEVSDQPTSRWQDAVLEGWKVFRALTARSGGLVECDLNTRTIRIIEDA
jgi:NTP pyrophosphatase (non-canonical NTP hydrolase)